MKEKIIKLVNVGKNEFPQYAHTGDAGVDLRADFSHPDNIMASGGDWDPERKCFVLFSGGRAAIPTGLKVKLPKGTYMQICSRSGLAIKSGIFVGNAPGIVDENFTGEICVILYNISDEPFEIKQGDRIAQAIVSEYCPIKWDIVDELGTTSRGEKGFGSTGVC